MSVIDQSLLMLLFIQVTRKTIPAVLQIKGKYRTIIEKLKLNFIDKNEFM